MFVNILGLMVLILLWFAQVGVTYFGGQLDTLNYENDGTHPDGTFDTLTAGVLSMFQLAAIGGADIMFALVNTMGWSIVWFFVVANIIIRLVMVNLLVGLILNMYSVAQGMDNPTPEEVLAKRIEMASEHDHEGGEEEEE